MKRNKLLRSCKGDYAVYWHKLALYKNPYQDGYIGFSKANCKATRFSGKLRSVYKSSPVFVKKIEEFGEENIQTIILHDGLTKAQSLELEKKYRPHPMIGWNIRQGGGNKGFHSSRTKQLISLKKISQIYDYNKIFTKSTREKIRSSKIGNKNCLGKKWTSETKIKMSISAKARGMNPNTYISNYKKVICVETGKIYDSQISASKDLQISNKLISSCCLGNSKTAGGLHWKYYE